MMIAISIMIAAAAACIMVFIIASPRVVPVLSGQRWVMPGLGKILIVKTLGVGASFGKGLGKHINVKYQLENGDCGYCTKFEVRSTGRLLPYDKHQRDTHIKSILSAIRRRSSEKEGYSAYSPPPGWNPSRKNSETIYEAEIVNQGTKRPDPGDKLAIDDLD